MRFSDLFRASRYRYGTKIADEPDDISSDGDDIDDDVDVDDGVLNFVGENLFVVQEVTVCNRPLCSLSERGVRCNVVDLDAAVVAKDQF